MCNLYSVTTGQAAIIALTRAMRDLMGNLEPMPGVFPDYSPVSAPLPRSSDASMSTRKDSPSRHSRRCRCSPPHS
jgi:hypothetical protein